MGETLKKAVSPERRVFGNAYSFRGGAADRSAQSSFYKKRLEALGEDKPVWIPRILDADRGICADLYKDRKIVATLVYDYDSELTDVYTTGEGGDFGDTTLCSQVAFDDAVNAADHFVENS